MRSAGRIKARLAELGHSLPQVSAAAGIYTPAVRTGSIVYTSGQLPLADKQLLATGQVGAEVTADEAAALTRVCALNALAAIETVAKLDNVTRIVKLTVFVSSATGFNDQALVANGASMFLKEVFDEFGVHARSAVGVAELPLDSPVEVELIVEVA
ncbi:LysR family transcriptional regulator (plasmid) [Rhodococcus erythropolis R138]|nr:LysR family transcriptional regulator [Rhodococcus erythropolis R138]